MDDYMLFGHLVPITFEKFAADAMGSVELMKLLVSCLDGNQVLNLISGYIHENITLFRLIYHLLFREFYHSQLIFLFIGSEMK